MPAGDRTVHYNDEIFGSGWKTKAGTGNKKVLKKQLSGGEESALFYGGKETNFRISRLKNKIRFKNIMRKTKGSEKNEFGKIDEKSP